MPIHVEPAVVPSTKRGRATRERIVTAAADLMYRHGVVGTSTPSIRDAAGVSSSQIYHYFGDKDDLTSAVITHQTDAIMSAQAQLLGSADNLAALVRWRDLLVDTARQQGGMGGCPLGSLASELADDHPWARAALSAGFDRWSHTIRDALLRLVDNRTLREDTDVDRLALALLAAIQGGLLLAQTQHHTAALEAGLDTAVDAIRAVATGGAPTTLGNRQSTAVQGVAERAAVQTALRPRHDRKGPEQRGTCGN
jgi:TetR/AcrR family transcriptional regulator, transcriptional repressor for nem operon